MTLRPNYLRVPLKVTPFVLAVVFIFNGVIPFLQGNKTQLLGAGEFGLFAGLGVSLFVALIFTPTEITWNDETIKIRALFPRSAEFQWRQLDAWSPNGNGVFLVKFEGYQGYQISPAGFPAKQWKLFSNYLVERFPEKKTSLWIGPKPIRLKGKKQP